MKGKNLEHVLLIQAYIDYIHFLWDHWAHCAIFENGFLLMYTLEGVSSVTNSLMLTKSLSKIETPSF